MPLADHLGPLRKLLPMVRLDGNVNLIRRAWDVLSVMPGGKAIFSRLVGSMAPYTATIHAQITVLRTSYCEATIADRRAVRNHLDCVHAVALVNLAELAGNIAVAYSMPDDARFIVSGLEIEYVKKARGTITAIGEPPPIKTNARVAYDVPVTLRDAKGEEVARAVLHTLIGPRKSSAGAVAVRTDVN